MEGQITRKWFFIGLVVSTLLVASLIFIPVLGQDDGGNPNNADISTEESSQTSISDGPLPGEVKLNPTPLPNDTEIIVWDSAVGSDASSSDAIEPMSMNAPDIYGSPLVIPAADFRSDGFQPTYYHFHFSTGAVEGANDTSSGCLMAPIYLPQGATVTDVWASIYDNNDTYNVPIYLRRVDNYDGTVDTIASLASSGASTSIQTPSAASISYPDVVYPNYSYYATVCVRASTTAVYSVRIYYNP